MKSLRTCLENVVGQASRLPLRRLAPVFSPARRSFIAGRRPAPLFFKHALSILEGFEWWPLFKRYTKFCVVGVTGMMVDMGILWLLADPSRLGWNLTLSKVIAA